MNPPNETELDWFCATDVMGYEAVERSPSFTDHNRTLTLQCGNKAFGGDCQVMIGEAYSCVKHPEGKPYMRQWRRFSPTTSPADAMAVLEKCAEEVGCYQIHIESEPWSVSCGKPGVEYAKAETLPLAICRFALQLFSTSKQ